MQTGTKTIGIDTVSPQDIEGFTPRGFEKSCRQRTKTLTKLTRIKAPPIKAFKAPKLPHSECTQPTDFAQATPDTIFQDKTPFDVHLVPGHGINRLGP